MFETIIGETKRECQKKAKRYTTLSKEKKGKKLIPLMVKNNFTHGLSNVASMQIFSMYNFIDLTRISSMERGPIALKFNSNGKSRTNTTHQRNLPLYNKG